MKKDDNGRDAFITLHIRNYDEKPFDETLHGAFGYEGVNQLAGVIGITEMQYPPNTTHEKTIKCLHNAWEKHYEDIKGSW